MSRFLDVPFVPVRSTKHPPENSAGDPALQIDPIAQLRRPLEGHASARRVRPLRTQGHELVKQNLLKPGRTGGEKMPGRRRRLDARPRCSPAFTPVLLHHGVATSASGPSWRFSPAPSRGAGRVSRGDCNDWAGLPDSRGNSRAGRHGVLILLASHFRASPSSEGLLWLQTVTASRTSFRAAPAPPVRHAAFNGTRLEG